MKLQIHRSKRFLRLRRLFALVGGLLLPAGLAHAQNYSLDWFVTGSAINNVTGGDYATSGTLGQSGAGECSGGPYTLTAGFWGGAYAGPRPALSIDVIQSGVILRWPASAVGWIPLTKDSVAPVTAWSRVQSAPVLVNGEFTLTLPAPNGPRFYQLWLP